MLLRGVSPLRAHCRVSPTPFGAPAGVSNLCAVNEIAALAKKLVRNDNGRRRLMTVKDACHCERTFLCERSNLGLDTEIATGKTPRNDNGRRHLAMTMDGSASLVTLSMGIFG